MCSDVVSKSETQRLGRVFTFKVGKVKKFTNTHKKSVFVKRALFMELMQVTVKVKGVYSSTGHGC